MTQVGDHKQPAPPLTDFVDIGDLLTLIGIARREDMGQAGVDVTSEVTVPADMLGRASMHPRREGIICGLACLPMVVSAYDAGVVTELFAEDGWRVRPGDTVAVFTGSLRSILAIERIALNFVTHLSGIATMTAQFVTAVADTKAKIYDTRKTIPGLRGLAKYAVACGGGTNHRMGLHDAVLIKDNHIAHLNVSQLADAITDAVKAARARHPAPGFVEVEVDTLEQLQPILQLAPDVRPDVVLLDNMTTQQLKQAVAMRDELTPSVQLEASGGVTLDTVRAIAGTGVDRIAVGAITHSAPTLDIALDITE